MKKHNWKETLLVAFETILLCIVLIYTWVGYSFMFFGAPEVVTDSNYVTRTNIELGFSVFVIILVYVVVLVFQSKYFKRNRKNNK